MKITESQLRRAIRKTLLEKKSIASPSDLAREKDFLMEWSELLLDELQERLPNGAAMADWKDKTRQWKVDELRSAVVLHLIGSLGYVSDGYGRKRDKWQEEERISKHHRSEQMRGLR